MPQSFPKWDELPEIDLYLDQVLLYVNQVAAFVNADKGLTSSMINNYVKHGLVDKPIKKKYNRRQLARLIAITTFKPVFSIQEVSHVLSLLTSDGKSQDCYDNFVACMNGDTDRDIPEIIISACRTLKLYQYTHQLALDLQGGQNHEH
ncbi:DUF1836 domain-containing protein [Streptococcus dentapri]|uniref:DUF1836 domain-containing protein n=1 Tax=Streptococcus dentapri TaxID=573564 RepID=A0ABV8D0F4_9STRE